MPSGEWDKSWFTKISSPVKLRLPINLSMRAFYQGVWPSYDSCLVVRITRASNPPAELKSGAGHDTGITSALLSGETIYSYTFSVSRTPNNYHDYFNAYHYASWLPLSINQTPKRNAFNDMRKNSSLVIRKEAIVYTSEIGNSECSHNTYQRCYFHSGCSNLRG